MIRVLPLLLLASCSVKPAIIPYKEGKPQHAIWLGGSLATKVDKEVISVTAPDGTKIDYYAENRDETVVPNSYIGYKTLTGLGDIANEGEKIRETNTTRRAISDNSVKKAEIKADVQKTAILNPVEETFGPP